MPEQRSRPRDGRVIALANQKGGTGKTTTTVNLGIGLARLGKKVLLIDADPQGDLTTCLGWQDQDSLQTTLATVMGKIIRDEPFTADEGILHHSEGVDLMPANIELSDLEATLVNAMSREITLRTYVNEAKKNYDVVLIDCMPSLGMITINALAAADSVIIPVQAHYLPAKGMTQLMKTINKVKRQINPALKVDGVLLTLVDGRTNLAKQTAETLRQSYGSVLKIYCSEIPVAIKAAEISAAGRSIYAYDNGSTMRSRNISVSIIIQNIAQLKALFEKQWESIIGNCDEFLYLGGNETSTHKLISENYLGKSTLWLDTYGKSTGHSGSYSTNNQLTGRELMTPDEVRMLDNNLALLFIRGEAPLMDEKYDLLKHPNVKYTTDGGAPAYTHGGTEYAVAGLTVSRLTPADLANVQEPETTYELLSDEDMANIFQFKEEPQNEAV